MAFGRDRKQHSVVRTDLMSGTDQRADMVSLKYMVGTTPTEIDNGSIVVLGNLAAGESGVFEAKDMAVDSAIENMVLVATPEVMYDERLDDLADFYNEAGSVSRGYRLRSGSIFSVTKEALAGLATPVVGNFVDRQVGNKGRVINTQSAATFGKIIAVETVGTRLFGRTYYAIQVL